MTVTRYCLPTALGFLSGNQSILTVRLSSSLVVFLSNEEDHAHGLVPILGGKLKDGAIDRLGERIGSGAVCYRVRGVVGV